MAIDRTAPEKVCPLCNKEYPEDDNYCGHDGALLVISDFATLASNTHPDREVVVDVSATPRRSR